MGTRNLGSFLTAAVMYLATQAMPPKRCHPSHATQAKPIVLAYLCSQLFHLLLSGLLLYVIFLFGTTLKTAQRESIYTKSESMDVTAKQALHRAPLGKGSWSAPAPRKQLQH